VHRQSPYILCWMATESVLRDGFRAVFLTTGPIVHVGEPVISIGWLWTTAKIPVEFRRAKLGMSVLLSPSGLLLSLRFAPQNLLGLGPSWTAPAYAFGSSVREVEVQVGSGEHHSRGTLTFSTSPGQHPCLRLRAKRPRLQRRLRQTVQRPRVRPRRPRRSDPAIRQDHLHPRREVSK